MIILSILVYVIGGALIVFLFAGLPMLRINNFEKRVNDIKYGMTKRQVKKLLGRRPFNNETIKDYSTGAILYEVEYYRCKTMTSDLGMRKNTITTFTLEIKITYFNDKVIHISKI